jgi:hypothetical protein
MKDRIAPVRRIRQRFETRKISLHLAYGNCREAGIERTVVADDVVAALDQFSTQALPEKSAAAGDQ